MMSCAVRLDNRQASWINHGLPLVLREAGPLKRGRSGPVLALRSRFGSVADIMERGRHVRLMKQTFTALVVSIKSYLDLESGSALTVIFAPANCSMLRVTCALIGAAMSAATLVDNAQTSSA
jgi:hypothetical protein